jgi:hypothetical protein
MLPYLLAAVVATAQCPLPNQTPMLVTQLFFGRDIAGRAPLTDAEWSQFVDDTLARNFPDGFTVSEGEGQWLDPKTHQVAQERSKIVIVAAAPAPDLARRTEAVMADYRTRFHQESVGVLTTTECGSF